MSGIPIHAAISNELEQHGFPQDRFYIHRKTGEIICIFDKEGEVDRYFGDGVATDAIANRSRLYASPDEWVEIPKYDTRVYGRGNEDKFIRDFFEEQGIDNAIFGD
jgi:hypothetical protein